MGVNSAAKQQQSNSDALAGFDNVTRNNIVASMVSATGGNPDKLTLGIVQTAIKAQIGSSSTDLRAVPSIDRKAKEVLVTFPNNRAISIGLSEFRRAMT